MTSNAAFALFSMGNFQFAEGRHSWHYTIRVRESQVDTSSDSKCSFHF